MTRESEVRKPSATRRVAEAALDVAVGGTALAADKAIETLDRVVEQGEEAVRNVREKTAHATASARKIVDERDGRAYEDRTRDELYALASERQIAGRSSMTKAELIAALRAER